MLVCNTLQTAEWYCSKMFGCVLNATKRYVSATAQCDDRVVKCGCTDYIASARVHLAHVSVSCQKLVLWYSGGNSRSRVLQRRYDLSESGDASPPLWSLHWLRVSERISFKLAVMTYQSIHGTSPSYLQSCFTRVSDMTSRRRLRSSTSHRLDVPPVRLSTVDRRAFPVSGATVWHDLPLHVASAPSLAVYKRLETFLFSRSYQDTIIWIVCHYHHSSLLSTPVVLAMINIISAT